MGWLYFELWLSLSYDFHPKLWKIFWMRESAKLLTEDVMVTKRLSSLFWNFAFPGRFWNQSLVLSYNMWTVKIYDDAWLKIKDSTFLDLVVWSSSQKWIKPCFKCCCKICVGMFWIYEALQDLAYDMTFFVTSCSNFANRPFWFLPNRPLRQVWKMKKMTPF